MAVETPHEFRCGCVAMIDSKTQAVYDVDRCCKVLREVIHAGRHDMINTHLMCQLNKERSV